MHQEPPAPPPKKVSGWGELFTGVKKRAARQDDEQKAIVKPPPSSISSHASSDSSATKKKEASKEQNSLATEPGTHGKDTTASPPDAKSAASEQPAESASKEAIQQPPQPPKPAPAAWKRPSVDSVTPVAVDWPTLDDAKQPGKSPVTTSTMNLSDGFKVGCLLFTSDQSTDADDPLILFIRRTMPGPWRKPRALQTRRYRRGSPLPHPPHPRPARAGKGPASGLPPPLPSQQPPSPALTREALTLSLAEELGRMGRGKVRDQTGPRQIEAWLRALLPLMELGQPRPTLEAPPLHRRPWVEAVVVVGCRSGGGRRQYPLPLAWAIVPGGEGPEDKTASLQHRPIRWPILAITPTCTTSITPPLHLAMRPARPPLWASLRPRRV